MRSGTAVTWLITSSSDRTPDGLPRAHVEAGGLFDVLIDPFLWSSVSSKSVLLSSHLDDE
jgi:hypothetical protein